MSVLLWIVSAECRCCRVLPCVAVCCRVLPCVAVCCSVLQWVAVCCSVLRYVAKDSKRRMQVFAKLVLNYVHVCVWLCAYACTLYAHTRTRIHKYKQTHAHTHTFARKHTYTHAHTHAHIIDVYMFIHVYIFIQVYTYTCMRVSMHINVYTYTHLHLDTPPHAGGECGKNSTDLFIFLISTIFFFLASSFEKKSQRNRNKLNGSFLS